MQKPHYLLATLIMLLFHTLAYAQNESKFSGSIDHQMKTLVEQAFPYDNFKVIRPALPQLQKNVIDTINYYKTQQNHNALTIKKQQSSIDSLNMDLRQKEAHLTQVEAEKDSFSFMGILMSKAAYSMLMWFIVLLLGIALAFYIYRFNNSRVTTRESKKNLEELKQEYEAHRKRALEREQKLKRDLLDELNKSGR